MTTHAPKRRAHGLSRRAYARRIGCSEGAIRQAIADGRLKGALISDGTLDPDKADALLAAATTAGNRPPADLAEARRRKAAAQCAILIDEVDALAGSVIPPDSAAAVCREMVMDIAARLYALADELAPQVAGLPPEAAADLLQPAIYARMTEIADDCEDGEGEDSGETLPPRGAGRKPLAKMTATELAALKADLQAERLELRRALKVGALVPIEAINDELVSCMADCRAHLLGIHVSTAPMFLSGDEQWAKQVSEEALSDAIENLAGRWASAEELTAGRHNRRSRLRGEIAR